jgi:hypothetical protein
VLILLTIIPVSLLGPSRGQPVDVAVDQTSVKMNMNLVLQENLTSLPSLNIYLAQSNSTLVLQPIYTAFRQLVPSARVASLELHARTSNSTGMWLLVENYSMIVTGATTDLGSSIRANISFIAMNVSQSLIVSNQELNAVGSTYLLAPLNAMDPKTTSYYIDGHQTLSAVIPAQTTITFWLLDLSWVPPISTWTENNDVLKQITTWSLDPPGPRYNLTIGRKSPEGPLIKIWTAVYNPSFKVSVPANALANGNTLSFDVPNPLETIMLALIVVSLTILIVSYASDKRLVGAQRIRKKRR